jgi:formamidopyrimidine-DNA glycosylase
MPEGDALHRAARRLRAVGKNLLLEFENGIVVRSQLRMRGPALAVYRRAGHGCPRCGTPIASRGQGDHNRIAYWCPGCQS